MAAHLCVKCSADISHKQLTALYCSGCKKIRDAERQRENTRTKARKVQAMINCLGCGTELFASRNKSGYCTKQPECRKLQAKWSAANSFSWTLPDDGIVDETAVYLAAHQVRPVQLTPTEQIEVVRKMIKLNNNSSEIARAAHVTPVKLTYILDTLGYENIVDTHTAVRKVMVIVPKIRNRNKLLEEPVLDIGVSNARGTRRRMNQRTRARARS